MTSPFGPPQLIVNPRAGRGSVERALPEITALLEAEGFEYAVTRTEGPGHAREIAREAVQRGSGFIVAVGGDGTVHEVVNGMMGDESALEPGAVLGVVPSGSGCDLVRTFGLPQDPVAAARHLLGKNVWGRLDIGRVRYHDERGSAQRWFVNIAEAGIGAAVVQAAARMPRALGGRAYRLAALRGVLTYHPQQAHLRMNGRKARGTRIDAPLDDCTHAGTITLVAVANCQFFGGGLRVAPRAIPSDGMLDVIIGEGTKWEAVRALQKMPTGEHVPSKQFTEYLANAVLLEGMKPLRIEADGELLGTTPATFDVIPGAIPLKI
jgi:diacylglycerol kinase (ATP)